MGGESKTAAWRIDRQLGSETENGRSGRQSEMWGDEQVTVALSEKGGTGFGEGRGRAGLHFHGETKTAQPTSCQSRRPFCKTSQAESEGKSTMNRLALFLSHDFQG